jgi:hypothetical protein
MQTNRTTTAQALLAAAFLLIVSASTMASDAFSKAGREQVIHYLNAIDISGDGLSEVFKDKLGGSSTVHGIVWWEVFGTLLAAESALADFEKGNFVAAGATLARMAADQLIPSTLGSHAALSGANAIANLAALPIRLSLNKFVKLVNSNAFKLQVELYKAARNRGLSHQQIMVQHKPMADISYDPRSGYLLSVGDLGAKFYGARIPMDKLITRDEVYELSRVAHESGSLTNQVKRERERAVREFVDYVKKEDSSLSYQNNMHLNKIELGVFRSLDLPDNNCPEQIIVMEKSTYYEGGYTVNGQANLSYYAESFSVIAEDRLSVTWAATLKPIYYQCVAAGGIVKINDEPYLSHSYLRLRFDKRKLYLILDMAGKQDPNGFLPEIIEKNIVNGSPTWIWSGTD